MFEKYKNFQSGGICGGILGEGVTGVTICRGARGRRLQRELARRAGSSEAIPTDPANCGRVSETETANCSLTSRRLFFSFSHSRPFPSPWYTFCHILASFHRYCHYHSCPGHFIPPSPTSPFVSPLLRLFSPALLVLSSLLPPPSLHPSSSS